MGKQLHEVLAVVAQRKGAAINIMTETASVFHGKHDLFNGLMKTFTPLAEDAETVEEDRVPLTTTVGDKLRYMAKMIAPWLDAAYQIDKTNQAACANIVLGAATVNTVPSTFLMQLAKRLAEIRGVCINIPTLDPKTEWELDPDRGRGIYRSISPDRRARTKKELRAFVKYPSTPEHPAQVEMVTEDHTTGHIDTLRWSGAITPLQKHELLGRIDTTLAAVKRALAQANQTEHSTDRVAKTLFGYLFGDLA